MDVAQFNQFADALPETLLLVGEDGAVLSANRALERLHLDVRYVVGHRLADLTTDSAEIVADYLRDCARSGEIVIGALTLSTPNGTVSVRCEGTRLRSQSPEQAPRLLLRLLPHDVAAERFQSLNQKIDELAAEVGRRLVAETNLRQQREWLQGTLASIGDAVIATDTQGKIVFMNRVAEQLTGWAERETTGSDLSSVFRIINELTRQPAENPVARTLREGKIVGLANHTVLIAKDGREIPIDDSAAPIRGQDGQLQGVVLVFRDVVERKRANAVRALLAAIVESSEDAIVGKSLDGIITSWNPAAERLYGYTAEEALGKPISMLVPPGEHNEFPEMIEKLKQGERQGHYESVRMRKDGSRLDVSVTLSPILDAEGRIVGASAIARDISATKRAEHRRNARLVINQILVQAPTINEAAPQVLRALCESLGWTVGALWLVDSNTQTLRCFSIWHSPSVHVPEFAAMTREAVFRPGQGLPGRIWSTQQCQWLVDATEDGNFPRGPVAIREGLRGACGGPIRAAEFFGVIELFSREPREPDEDLLEMLSTVGGQIGHFIERTRAVEVLREETEIAETLHRIGVAVASDLDVDKLLQRVTDETTSLVAAEFGAFFYNAADEKGDFYTLVSLSGADRERFRDFPMPRSTEIFGPTLRGERVIRSDDITKDPRYGRNPPYHGPPPGHLPVRSYLAVPVVSRSGQVFGGLFYGHSQPGKFDERDERILVGVAAEAAIGIDNARLYKASQESEQRFRQLAEHVSGVFWMVDALSKQVLYVSPAYEEIWGRTCQSLYDHPSSYLEAVHPDDRKALLDANQRNVEGEVAAVEYRVMRPDGSIRWMWDRGHPIRDAQGRVVRVAGIAEDITRRKQSEEAANFLANASATLATLVDCESTLRNVAQLAVPMFADWCSVDLVEADRSLRRVAVAHVNPAKVAWAEELRRRNSPQRVQLRGAPHVARTGVSELISDIADETFDPPLNEEQKKFIRELQLRSYIAVPLVARGQVLAVVTFVAAESGRRYDRRDLAVAEDLAHRATIAIENARLYQEVKQAAQRKDEFLATLAHELRNPLAPIRNAVELMQMGISDQAELTWAQNVIERQVQLMTRLVDDLLDVSRITRGRVELRKEAVDAIAIVNRAIETTRPLVEERQHRLRVTFPGEPVRLEADPTRLEQVLTNLINNAAKYTEPGGQIDVSAQRVGHELMLTVRDSGIGIAPEALPHIFDLFVQAQNRSDLAQGGLGIGLTLVRELIEMHGGRVTANSPGAGQGSEFTVYLPLLAEAHAAPSSAPPSNAPSATAPTSTSRRILVVDDNVDAARTFSALLEHESHVVHVAHHGADALTAVAELQPDVVFLDLGLPELNGFEVARRIRRLPGGDRIFLVALTGWGTDDDRRRSQEAGFDLHMVKPPEPAAVRSILEHPRLKGAGDTLAGGPASEAPPVGQ